MKLLVDICILIILSTFPLQTFGACKNLRYSTDVFYKLPEIISDIDECEFACAVYACKVNRVMLFGQACTEQIYSTCNQNMTKDEKEANSKEWNLNESFSMDILTPYQYYMENGKGTEDDSLQERFFWMTTYSTVSPMIPKEEFWYWSEKAATYIPIKLRNLTADIPTIRQKVKEEIAKRMDIQVDIETIKKAVKLDVKQKEYFQNKLAEVYSKMNILEASANNFTKHAQNFVMAANESLQNEYLQWITYASKTRLSINQLDDDVFYSTLKSIHDNILLYVKRSKEDFYSKLATLIVNSYDIPIDEITYIKNVAYIAQIAIDDFTDMEKKKAVLKGKKTKKLAENSEHRSPKIDGKMDIQEVTEQPTKIEVISVTKKETKNI